RVLSRTQPSKVTTAPSLDARTWRTSFEGEIGLRTSWMMSGLEEEGMGLVSRRSGGEGMRFRRPAQGANPTRRTPGCAKLRGTSGNERVRVGARHKSRRAAREKHPREAPQSVRSGPRLRAGGRKRGP